MIKISALNEETEEESRSEEEVTREALEQIALQQYTKALELHKKGNLRDATQLLKDLLDTELVDEIKKPAEGEKITSPLFNMKYLCYKNLASMLGASGEISAAIESSCAAVELDDGDVTLWHRLGGLCIRAQRYEMALHAFQRGTELNPRHWPCLDKIVTLLLGLDYKEECIATIYDTLELDPGYLRGLAYRRHIYTAYSYIRDFMEYLNPMYRWNEQEDDPIDEECAVKLLKEAEEIHETFLEQQRADQFKCQIPDLKLKKPISKPTWESVGDSLIHMHHHMTQYFFSHASHILIVCAKEEKEEPMEVCEDMKGPEPMEIKTDDDNLDSDKQNDVSENGNNDMSDKDKATTDTEKVESDVEMVATEPVAVNSTEPKRKQPTRRRGSALSFLEQWEWCNKRRSGRKKPVNRPDRLDDNIYDTLRRMVPVCLSLDIVQKKEDGENNMLVDINTHALSEENEGKTKQNEDYFGTEGEQKDVKQFINKYTHNKTDIIDMLKDFLNNLAGKWEVKWSAELSKVFIEANKCYNNHIDTPLLTGGNTEDLLHYTAVNLLVEELTVNEKLSSATNDKTVKPLHDLSVIESIGNILTLSPHTFPSTDILEFMLRYLWVKLHVHMLNKCDDFGLDCLYQLAHEFDALGEFQEHYSLNIVNFTFKPTINEEEIAAYIKFLERNKRLSTVKDLYDLGNYEDVLSIVIDSFEHCKDLAKKQEEEMSLDFALQLSMILDAYWALDDVNNCFKWSLICLHEALKHYFRFTSGSPDYQKWTWTVVKILCCMEHILTTEGLLCLESVSRKELSQGLEDLIRIIGHQVETNTAEMPFGTVVPWIVMHFILQREEDQGRGRTAYDKDKVSCDEVPNPLMVLFIAHEQLGIRGWCCKSEGRLLYFILDTVVPRLRSPYLSKSLEQVCHYMEQCVYCLFGHPGKKNKLKYLIDHNVTPHTLDWKRAQQLYEIYRPPELPALEGKNSGITADTEQLFHRILELLPAEIDPHKYIPDVEKYIKNVEDKLPKFPPLLPYRMKDIYFLLGDYYFKKEEGKMTIKYNILDVIVNNNRLESWAEISLAKAVNLERLVNSCKNLNNEREFLTPAKSIIRCFKRALELDPTHCNMWIEYGMFVYTVHSFCSRVLKQASESLSMEDFEFLEKQKEDMLDTTQKCFLAVLGDMNSSNNSDKSNEDAWLHYYMLGKVAEKRKKSPSVYLQYYMQGVKSLQETNATYPLKINYSSPTHLCIEVLELHYRIHASILKYIEQHENKPIPMSIGKVFTTCIEEWNNGPFTKKVKKDATNDPEPETKSNEPVQAANILKRSISDAGEDETHEAKKLKLQSAAAKIRRSVSYDTERFANKEPQIEKTDQTAELVNKPSKVTTVKEKKQKPIQDVEPQIENTDQTAELVNKPSKVTTVKEKKQKPIQDVEPQIENTDQTTELVNKPPKVTTVKEKKQKPIQDVEPQIENTDQTAELVNEPSKVTTVKEKKQTPIQDVEPQIENPDQTAELVNKPSKVTTVKEMKQKPIQDVEPQIENIDQTAEFVNKPSKVTTVKEKEQTPIQDVEPQIENTEQTAELVNKPSKVTTVKEKEQTPIQDVEPQIENTEQTAELVNKPSKVTTVKEKKQTPIEDVEPQIENTEQTAELVNKPSKVTTVKEKKQKPIHDVEPQIENTDPTAELVNKPSKVTIVKEKKQKPLQDAEPQIENTDQTAELVNKPSKVTIVKEKKQKPLQDAEPQIENTDQTAELVNKPSKVTIVKEKKQKPMQDARSVPEVKKNNEKRDSAKKSTTEKTKQDEVRKKSSSSSASSSSSDSNSSGTSSESSSESSRDSKGSVKSHNSKPLSEEEIMKIVSACLDALEDCASRFPPHYKAIYRLAHYHFYYKKGKDIERCRDLMLSNFTSRTGQKLGGLFSERKHSNFFNNIWKIPSTEVDRAGGFAFHMNRSVLLSMEILKEIDDHKTLLDLSLHLQRIPELDKKYLRDSDREELAQQAFSLCVQSLKGQLWKFSQQADLKSNDVEQQALKSLMLDIYRAYQRAQKQPNSKQFTNLLVDAYKLVTVTPVTENMNLVDLSMKYCQTLIQTLKQQATQASLDKSQNTQKKHTTKVAESAKSATSSNAPTKTDYKAPKTTTPASIPGLPKMSSNEISAAFQSYLPMLNTQDLSRQTAAALSLWGNLSTVAGYSPALRQTIQTTLQSSLHNSFQAEFFRQFIGQSFSSFNVPPPKKQKRGPKPGSSRSSQAKPMKSFNIPPMPATSKTAPTSIPKSSTGSLAPSMGTVLSSLPASMAANLTSFGAASQPITSAQSSLPAQAHMSSAATAGAPIHTKPLSMPHQQGSPGKTLQEKLAERQKNLPSMSKGTKELTASINKLPSSLTITKKSVAKQSHTQAKRNGAKKTLPFGDAGGGAGAKPISTDEVIVLDDD